MMDSPKSDTEDVQRLTKLLEESMQEAHELRSRLQITERCVQDYEAELEALQRDAFEKEKSHATAIREIEEEKSNAVKEAEERIESWALDYQVLSEKLAAVQRELEEKSVNTENLTKEKNESAALYIELQETIEALAMSTAACNQHKEFISVLQNEKRELAQRVQMLEENLEYYKENLSILKSQLSAQTEEYKELQEQLAVTQSELVALKATPDVKSRGNSLFAEVEDNRQQMAKDYKIMLAKFGFMKKDYTTKCSEIAKLKKEKTILLDRLEVAEREAKKHYRAFVENYEIRIKELEMTINRLKNDVKPVYLNGNDEILKFAEQTVVNSRKEVLSLREEMEMRSALRLNEAAELLKTRGELAQARADLRKSSLKIKELSITLNERGIAQPSTAVSEPTSPEEKLREKTEIPERVAITKICAVSKQMPKQVVFEEELLHDKFNSRKRDVEDVLAVQESPSAEEMKMMDPMDELATSLKETTDSTEVADESSRGDPCFLKEDGTKDADIVGDPKILDGEFIYERDVSVGKNSGVKGSIKYFESSMQGKRSIRKEESAEILPQLENDDFSAPLILSPCSSEYLDPEDEKMIESMLNVTLSPPASDGGVKKIDSMLNVNFSPASSDEKNGITERTSRPFSERQSDNSICDVSVLSLDSRAETLCFNSTKCETMSSSIRKVRSNIFSFENTLERPRQEVRIDKEGLEKEVLSRENFSMKEREGDESNKENSPDTKVENEKEEKKSARRRPRPKQTHPIIYMT